MNYGLIELCSQELVFQILKKIQSKAFFQVLVCIFLGILMLSQFSKLYLYIFKELNI